MTDNYYTMLGVAKTASKDEIKKAYRGLQMKYHPDKNPGNVEANIMTQKINEAYEVLSDDQQKAEYDMNQNNPFMRMNSHGPQHVHMDDIFSMLFSGGHGGMPFPGMPGMPGIHVFQGGMHMNKPIPIIKTLPLTMEQIFTGGSFPLEIERWVLVLEDNTKMFETETIYVEVPKGIDDNEFIILRERGNVISEQCKGDIKINIAVNNTTAFKREGLDLYIEKKITLKEALCGFTFQLEHLNGKSYGFNNNKGVVVQPEYKKTCKHMGLIRGEHKGNLIIQFHVEFPELSLDQIDKLSELL